MANLRHRDDHATTPNALVGAARRVHIDRREEVQALRERGIDERQMFAWRYYDSIGEVKSAYNYFASVASRLRFFTGYVPVGGDVPTEIGDVGNLDRSLVTAARYELSKLNNGRGGQPGFIRAFVLNMLVAGEGYIVGANGKWSFRSTSELRFEQDNKVRMVISRRQRGTYMHYLPADAFIARVWRMHPQFSDDPDAALHGVLSECGELLLLARLIRASARSRLNAGLLYVADELRFQKPGQQPDVNDTPQPDIDPFEEELTLALTEPVGETDSPSEIVPLIIRGPAQFAKDGINYIDLSRNFDPALITRHDQTLARIMQGIELPQDIISGFAKVRYSNVGAVSEDFIKSYLEPMAVLIAEALTTVFLRPQLIARGYDPTQVERVAVWYDTSAVVNKPDRSQDADNGYKQMVISGATWRRAHGFTDADAPSAEEIVRRVALTGAMPPNAIVDMLRELAPQLIEKAERLSGHSMDQPVPGTNMTGEIGQSADTKQSIAQDTNPSRNPFMPNGPGGHGHGSGVTGPRSRAPQDPMANVQPPGGKTTPSNPTPPPEGTLPPEANQALHVPAERLDTAVILAALTEAITAASTPSEFVQTADRRLEMALEVERRLRESMSVHLNDVVRRALERAGARTVSKIRGDHSLKTLVMDVPIEEAFASVPADRRATFGLDDDRLLRDTIENAKASFFELVRHAQDQGWRALGVDVLETMKTHQDTYLSRAWDWLVGQLLTLAKRHLNAPQSGTTPRNYVPMQVIRDAATLAGGGEHQPAPDKSVAPRSNPPDSGRAILGAPALQVMTVDDIPVEFGERYRWVYGISERHFEPHVELDGRIFSSWEGTELAAHDPSGWPYTSHYYPGDHDGCRCDWLPEVLDPAHINAVTLPERVAASAAP